MTNKGGEMRKMIKKSSSRKRSPATENENVVAQLTDSERRLLKIIATGIEGEEPNVLAGRR
jgi:hypothetical protein